MFIFFSILKQLLKISISHCERSMTCQECVSTSDPVCGWCNMDSRYVTKNKDIKQGKPTQAPLW